MRCTAEALKVVQGGLGRFVRWGSAKCEVVRDARVRGALQVMYTLWEAEVGC